MPTFVLVSQEDPNGLLFAAIVRAKCTLHYAALAPLAPVE